jgi:hypothetical protein
MPQGLTTSTDTRRAPSLGVAWSLEVAVGTEVGVTVSTEMASCSALEATLGSRGRDWTRTGRVCSGSGGVDIDGVSSGTQQKESPGHSSSLGVDDSICRNAASSRKRYHSREGPDAKYSGAASTEASRTLSRRRRRRSGVVNLGPKGLEGRGRGNSGCYRPTLIFPDFSLFFLTF